MTAASPLRRVLLAGAGGHALVVADTLQRMGAGGEAVEIGGCFDDNPALTGGQLLGIPVLGAIADIPTVPHDAVIIGIGDNAARRRVFDSLQAGGEQFVVARHPSAVVGADVTIGPGTMMAAGVVVNPGARIGANVILNTGCTIDHHSVIGDHAHVAPGAHLGGEVSIGEGALVGIGAAVLPGRRVGKWSVVGAQALIRRDVADGRAVVGVPARGLR
jgi:sugar O-acyltransferase (sialic acid O-acetyltransferase NeuD family)